MKRSFGVLGGLILSVVALNVQAVPDMVNPWHSTGNGSATWPSDSHSGLELSTFPKSGWGKTSIEGYTAIQAYGFSDLQGASYTSSPVGDIGLMSLAGNRDGQYIQFDSSPASQHAIDNIRLEVGNLLDFTAVPVPTVAWLFAPGLLGMVAVARRHQF
jgi:hypothetical protein